jgi:hypothetical protein
MPPGQPEKKLRWDRVILAILVLAGIGAGIFLLMNR